MSLLARYAEHLFWLARYVERASSLARIIEVHLAFDRGRSEEVSWAWLVALHSDQERFAQGYSDASLANVIKFYVDDMSNPGSIRFSLRAARENARALRAVISTEMWSQLNEFYNRIRSLKERDLDPVRLSRTCGQIKDGCYAQLGVTESTLYRDEGWRFFLLGMMMERADQTSRLLDVKFAQLQTVGPDLIAPDEVFWLLVLRSAAAHQAFMRIERRAAGPAKVAQFLLANGSHPRSVIVCVNQIERLLHELRTGFGLRGVNKAQEKAEILGELIVAAGRNPQVVDRLHGINDRIQRDLIELGSELGQAFFGHPPPSGQFQSQSQSLSQSQSSAAPNDGASPPSNDPSRSDT
ncbi:MAG: alpha-E domain-containing protein [Hyphomicrobiaceae bacterium]|nr:alpha-E domain-containing protein [Hyphomicrobiaceae bacterium]